MMRDGISFVLRCLVSNDILTSVYLHRIGIDDFCLSRQSASVAFQPFCNVKR